jgi:hypothetical protein
MLQDAKRKLLELLGEQERGTQPMDEDELFTMVI